MQLNHLDPEPMVTCSPSGDFTDVGPPSLFFTKFYFLALNRNLHWVDCDVQRTSDTIWLVSCEKVATRKKKSKMKWKQSNVATRNSWIQWLKSWHNSWLMDQCTTQMHQLSRKKWRVIKRADSVSFLETAHSLWLIVYESWTKKMPQLEVITEDSSFPNYSWEAKTSFYFLHSVIEAIHDSAFAYQTSKT